VLWQSHAGVLVIRASPSPFAFAQGRRRFTPTLIRPAASPAGLGVNHSDTSPENVFPDVRKEARTLYKSRKSGKVTVGNHG